MTDPDTLTDDGSAQRSHGSDLAAVVETWLNGNQRDATEE